MKLHLGCDDRRFKDCVNVDYRKTRATDLICDARILAFRDNSIDLIAAFHLIEHLPRPNVLMALEEWHRVMKPKAKLIIECPDFDRAIKDYLGGNEQRLKNIFGLQRFADDFHFWGWNHKRLKRILKYIGFKHVKSKQPQDYHSIQEPCLRMECNKR